MVIKTMKTSILCNPNRGEEWNKFILSEAEILVLFIFEAIDFLMKMAGMSKYDLGTSVVIVCEKKSVNKVIIAF